jgi:hypothetical protein
MSRASLPAAIDPARQCAAGDIVIPLGVPATWHYAVGPTVGLCRLNQVDP